MNTYYVYTSDFRHFLGEAEAFSPASALKVINRTRSRIEKYRDHEVVIVLAPTFNF